MTDSDPQGILDALLDRCDEFRTPCGDGRLVWRVWNNLESQRPPLMLLHGGSGAWNHWVRTIPALEPHFRVIAPDLPGCGDSADPPAPCDAASLAALLSDGLDVVVADDTPFHLVSFSFGGLLSGLIAHAQARRILSLTIVGSPVLGLNRAGPANDLASVPPDLPPHEAVPIYRSNLQKLMVRDPAAVDDLAMALHMTNMAKVRLRSRSIARAHPMAETLRDLPCHLNCIFGDSDVTLYPDLAGIRAHMEQTCPDSAFHVIPNSGHWVQYESPEAFNARLMKVLATEEAASRTAIS
jgi:2-hydroxy-6-oxonona-2,4-dienedioate hydrolase